MPRSTPLFDTTMRLLRLLTGRSRRHEGSAGRPGARGGSAPPRARFVDQASGDAYPGDYTSRPKIVYRPRADDHPDPGEVVWTWVPYEEDHSRGKDRPSLIIGRDGAWLLGLQVTSQDHDRDRDQEARAGRYWIDIGTGAWDAKRRPSEARVNRIIRIDPNGVRRIGAILDESTFRAVAREVLRHY